MADQTITVSRFKGSSPPQEENGFQNGRLASTVWASDDAEVWGKI
jgi:hypothetical protein